MAITFKQFADGNTEIKVVSGLVLGFMTETFEHEQLYAIRNDGKIFMSDIIAKPNHSFNGQNRNWTEVPSVPDHAEWIGHYRF